jgi:hypothetical protein
MNVRGFCFLLCSVLSALPSPVVRTLSTTRGQDLHLYMVPRTSNLDGEAKQVSYV